MERNKTGEEKFLWKRKEYCDRLATHTWTGCFGNAKKNERVQRQVLIWTKLRREILK